MFKKYYIYLLGFIITIFSFFSCSGDNMDQQHVSFNSIHDIPDATWEKLSNITFYFGHQSVGWNILKGIEELKNDNKKIKLNVLEGNDAAMIVPGTLLHSKVGKNTDPKSKIEEFVNHINNGIGKKANAAALKLCYVDIRANTDSDALFAAYENEVNNIRKAYPDLVMIHFTSPLTTLQTGPKAWVKKMIGRPVYGVKENVIRHKYNELIRSKYKGKEPIFDIALIESTRLNGSRSAFQYDGNTYYSLAEEFTTDGGHLNKIGRKRVAEQLILFLAKLAQIKS